MRRRGIPARCLPAETGIVPERRVEILLITYLSSTYQRAVRRSAAGRGAAVWHGARRACRRICGRCGGAPCGRPAGCHPGRYATRAPVPRQTICRRPAWRDSTPRALADQARISLVRFTSPFAENMGRRSSPNYAPTQTNPLHTRGSVFLARLRVNGRKQASNSANVERTCV